MTMYIVKRYLKHSHVKFMKCKDFFLKILSLSLILAYITDQTPKNTDTYKYKWPNITVFMSSSFHEVKVILLQRKVNHLGCSEYMTLYYELNGKIYFPLLKASDMRPQNGSRWWEHMWSLRVEPRNGRCMQVFDFTKLTSIYCWIKHTAKSFKELFPFFIPKFHHEII